MGGKLKKILGKKTKKERKKEIDVENLLYRRGDDQCKKKRDGEGKGEGDLIVHIFSEEGEWTASRVAMKMRAIAVFYH